MMIEADVNLGYVLGDASSGLQPIMAHPPTAVSDLSVIDFMNIIVEVYACV